MDREQLDRFLTAVETKTPRYYPLFFVTSRTGLRLGEALAFRWDDLDLAPAQLREPLLAKGVSPAYVQEQLGHASIELTRTDLRPVAPQEGPKGGGPPRREGSGSRRPHRGRSDVDGWMFGRS